MASRFPDELPIVKEVFCAKDRATAIEMAAPYLEGKYKDYATWGQDKVMPGTEDFTQSFDELAKGRFILGSPEECYEGCEPYWEEFGVNHLLIRTHWAGMPLANALSSIRLISDELLPELREDQALAQICLEPVRRPYCLAGAHCSGCGHALPVPGSDHSVFAPASPPMNVVGKVPPQRSTFLYSTTTGMLGQRLTHDADRLGLGLALDLDLVGLTVGAGLVGVALRHRRSA